MMRLPLWMVLVLALSILVLSCGKEDEMPSRRDAASLQDFISEHPESKHIEDAKRLLSNLRKDARAFPLLERRWPHQSDTNKAVIRAVDESVASVKSTNSIPFRWTTEVNSTEVRLKLFGLPGAEFDETAKGVEEKLAATDGIGDFDSTVEGGWKRSDQSAELSEVLVLDYDQSMNAKGLGSLVKNLETESGILEVTERLSSDAVQFEVFISPHAFDRYSIRATEIVAAIHKEEARLRKDSFLGPMTVDRLSKLVMAESNGEVIRLEDAARVDRIREDHGASAFLGGRRVLTFSVFRKVMASEKERDSLRETVLSLLEIPSKALHVIPCEKVSNFEFQLKRRHMSLHVHRDFDQELGAGKLALSEWHSDGRVMRILTPNPSLSLAKKARRAPLDCTVTAIRFDSSVPGRAYDLVIEGSSFKDLHRIYYDLTPQLRKIDSVMVLQGNPPSSFQKLDIDVNDERCAALGISKDDVEMSIKMASGGLRTETTQILLQVGRDSVTPKSLASMTVRSRKQGQSIALKDIASVRTSEESNLYSRNGVLCARIKVVIGPEAQEAKTLETIRQRITAIKLPKGMTVLVDELGNP